MLIIWSCYPLRNFINYFLVLASYSLGAAYSTEVNSKATTDEIGGTFITEGRIPTRAEQGENIGLSVMEGAMQNCVRSETPDATWDELEQKAVIGQRSSAGTGTRRGMGDKI